MELLLALLIIFFILPWVFRQTFPWLLRWFVRRQTRKFMGGAFSGGMPGGSGAEAPGKQEPPRPRRRKKIDPSVGEYIEFTEIEGYTSGPASKPAGGRTESQISDVEWEDLP